MTGYEIEKEHAVKIIKAMRTNWDEDSKTPNAHALDMAIKALEKQIPKNLVCIEDKFLHCPCCDEALSYKWEKYPTEKINLDWLEFCWNCGQALKWE